MDKEILAIDDLGTEPREIIEYDSKLWQIFHIDLTHSSYTATPFTVRRYFWRG